MAAARIIAVEAAVAKLTPSPPPPPPPPSTAKPFTLFRYGDSFNLGTPSTYGQHYGTVVVGYGDDNKVSTVAPARLLDYRTSVETSDATDAGVSLSGVTFAEAVQLGVALKDASGAYVFDTRFGTHYGLVGSPAYSGRWVQNVAARVKTYGLAGVFMDNVTAIRGDFGGLSAATAWADDAAFEEAMYAHIVAVRAGLPGAYIMANVGRARDRVGWWERIAAAGVNELCIESYDGSDAHNLLIRTAEDAGRAACALVYGDPASPAIHDLAAKFATVTNGKSTFAVNSGGADPWNTNWTAAIKP